MDEAAAAGDLATVRNLVEDGIDIEMRNSVGRTALMIAASEGHLEVVRYLVELGTNENTSRQMPILSFKSVSSGGYLDGRNPGMSDPCLASLYQNPTSVAYLQWIVGDAENGYKFIKSVSSGGYLDGRNPGMSDPCLSFRYENPTSVPYLQWIIGCAGNGRVFIKSISSGGCLDGRTPHRVLYPLLASGDRNPTSEERLQWVIESKDGRIAPIMTALGLNEVRRVNINATTSDGWTALMMAARQNCLDVVRCLVGHSADIETKNNDGSTALIIAAHGGCLKVVRYLIKNHANIEAKNNDGSTALIIAAHGGCLKVVRYLIKNHANIEAKNNDGSTALLGAARNGCLDVVRYLVETGANPSVLDVENGNSVLIYLVSLNGAEKNIRPIVKLVLVHGCPPLRSNNDGNSARSIARENCYLSVIDLIDEYAAKQIAPAAPRWFISPDVIVKTGDPALGRGGFGTVYRAMRGPIENKIEVVVKEIWAEELRRFVNEVEMWRDLTHPNVVPFYGANHRQEPFFIVSMYASKGELRKYLSSEKERGRTVVWRKLREVAAGLSYLHEQKVVHGDLRGNNIVVSKHGKAMLTDFGLSFFDSASSCTVQKWRDRLGAMEWRAPELMGATKPSFESDVYSLGMCIIEAVKNEHPWDADYTDDKIREFLKLGKINVKQPVEMTDEQWELVKKMIAYNAKDRPKLNNLFDKLKKFADVEQDTEDLKQLAERRRRN